MRFLFFWKRNNEDNTYLRDYTGIGGHDSAGAEATVATDRGGLLA